MSRTRKCFNKDGCFGEAEEREDCNTHKCIGKWIILNLYRAKLSSGETIRWAKFSSPNEKFVTFARRKNSPNKSKSVFS